MQLFLTDLWADLREKRLWPVAVALLLGLIAVPLVVAKPAEQAPAAAPAPPVRSQLPNAGLRVLADQDSTGEGSDLGVFDPKDPFRPPASVVRNSKKQAGASTSSSPAASPNATGQSPTTTSSSPPPSGGAGGSSGSSGGGTPTGGGPTGGGVPTHRVTRTQRYTYVIDVTFTQNSRTRKIEGMHRLDMLPSQSNPLLLFMGVDSRAANAVFLVDSTLHGTGEGRCKPSASDCSFLYLGAGSEHQFHTDDGETYTLRLDHIRRVRVRASGARAGSSRSRPKSHRASAERRRFVPPVLVDFVDVATTDSVTSSRDKRHR